VVELFLVDQTASFLGIPWFWYTFMVCAETLGCRIDQRVHHTCCSFRIDQVLSATGEYFYPQLCYHDANCGASYLGISTGGLTDGEKNREYLNIQTAASHIFTKPATTQYPFVKPQLPDDARCKTVYEVTSCNVIDIGTGQKDGPTLDVRSITGSNCRVCVEMSSCGH